MDTAHEADGACVGRSRSQQWADARPVPTLVILERCIAYFVVPSLSMGRDTRTAARASAEFISYSQFIHPDASVWLLLLITHTHSYTRPYGLVCIIKLRRTIPQTTGTFVRAHQQRLHIWRAYSCRHRKLGRPKGAK